MKRVTYWFSSWSEGLDSNEPVACLSGNEHTNEEKERERER